MKIFNKLKGTLKTESRQSLVNLSSSAILLVSPLEKLNAAAVDGKGSSSDMRDTLDNGLQEGIQFVKYN